MFGSLLFTSLLIEQRFRKHYCTLTIENISDGLQTAKNRCLKGVGKNFMCNSDVTNNLGLLPPLPLR